MLPIDAIVDDLFIYHLEEESNKFVKVKISKEDLEKIKERSKVLCYEF